MTYEQLALEIRSNNIEIYEEYMPQRIKGLYADNIIWINKFIPTFVEKACVLAEEFGHYHTSTGDILDQASTKNRKQELKARTWAYEKLIPLSKIIQAHKLHISNSYELADFLNVTEEFLDEALEWYRSKYGLFLNIDNFTICFEPLGVIEMFDWFDSPIMRYGSIL
ncbi:ImmA/IrrE family metallo-endopeptidase [Lysinibacillus capsici]|uniref:ImmA/IrrE family metallo-endopeptidase n=1 Tax=Lysinibacillus capsici TaxID=2115968 RepID=UPI000E2031FE|nr:ImmA/IrrE family metallo-endopeptidase [Lysinibacillus capsici]RDV27133.1 ImmA/IrrE family metallo-endopeptidase [Lysinibacillus capsici]